MTTIESTPNWLKQRNHLTPERVAVIFRNEKYTFKEIYQRSKIMARKLAKLGVKKGTRTAVLLHNHVDTVVVIYALQLIGSTAVMLNIRLQDDELLFQLEDSEPILIITESDFEKTALAIGKQLSIPVLLKENLPTIEEQDVVIREEFGLDEVCTLMYTSGTTGFPKGVIQTYGNHWWSCIGSVLNLGLREGDAWLAAVPLFHISGYSILIRSIVYGIPIVLYEKFDEKKINQDLIDGKATIMSVVTTMLRRLIEDLGERAYHSDFRSFLLGGGPVPLALLENCKKKQIPVFQSYGLTETSSQIVTLAPEDSLTKLGSAGKPLFPSQIKIMLDHKEAGPKEIGEIVVKGPNVTKGYFKRDEAKRKSFTEDGWFFTGDVGYLDEEGYLFVIDRRSDLIISGGENIYPAEVENIIQYHPAIQEAAVVGVDDPYWGQVPYGFYVAKANQTVTEGELTAFCHQHLAKFKIPKKWFSIDELPKNASNKILRRVLKERAQKLIN